MTRTIPALVSAAALLGAVAFAPAGLAAELPQSVRDMLKELKIDEKLLEGSESEYEVPAAWIEGAKKEGKLRIVGTWDPGQHEKYMKPFQERYPDVKFDYTRAGRQDRAVKPLLAFKEGRYLVDVVSGLGNAYFLYRDAKALMKLTDLPNAKLLADDLLDPAGFWVGHQSSHWCVSYNTKKVSKDDLPKTWEGFLDASKWGNNRIGMGNRANLWFVQLWKAHGADWARDYMDKLFNEVKPQQRKEGMNALVELVIAGEFDVTIPSAMYRVAQLAEKGAPIGYHCPEPVPSTVQSVVALEGNPNPNATRIYVNWMISKEGQVAQYYALSASSVREELQIPELVAYPEAIKGKKKSFRDPELLQHTWPQVLKAWSAHWDSAGGVKTVNAKIEEVIREGRELAFKAGNEIHTVKISGSRTAKRIAGKTVDRGAFKKGMDCTFVYPDNKGEAREVICK